MPDLKCCACNGRGTSHGHDHGREIVTICGWCNGTGKEPNR